MHHHRTALIQITFRKLLFALSASDQFALHISVVFRFMFFLLLSRVRQSLNPTRPIGSVAFFHKPLSYSSMPLPV